MKKTPIVFGCLLLVIAATAFAQNAPETNKHYYPPKGPGWARPGGGGGQNLVFHTGGKVLRNAHVVMIFWGTFPSGYTSAMQSFRNNFGTTGEYNVITQYYGTDDNDGSYGNISQSNLAAGPADYFDSSAPPTNVTDAAVQAEVNKAIIAQGGTDYGAIYEVFIPSGSYSSDGSSTSCGGPNLAY